MSEKIIAVLWDFDKTLISGYMQAPLFEHYGVDPARFWDEVNALPGFHAEDGEREPFASDTLYLNHILAYVRAGAFAGLDNAMLRSFGARQRLAPGVPEIFESTARLARGHEAFRKGGIAIEHYVITTGLRQIVLGSAVAPHVRHVWGCELLERAAPPGFLDGAAAPPRGALCDIGYVIDHTTKTRAIFEINKGVREGLGVHVDTAIPQEERRVPFENMIYIADGPSDVPSLSVIKQRGGRTFGVYEPGSAQALAQAALLSDQRRVDGVGPADYRRGTSTTAWLLGAIGEIGERLARSPAPRAARSYAPTPRHFYEPGGGSS